MSFADLDDELEALGYGRPEWVDALVLNTRTTMSAEAKRARQRRLWAKIKTNPAQLETRRENRKRLESSEKRKQYKHDWRQANKLKQKAA